jgi:hypothetical protein
LEIAGAGFVFGIAAGMFAGILDTDALWPSMCAGLAGVGVSSFALTRLNLRGWRRLKRAFAPRISRKA